MSDLTAKHERNLSEPTYKKIVLIFVSAKFLSITTAITAAFGFYYQKGLINGMHLGNAQGSYGVKEIFSSALEGYLYIFIKIQSAIQEYSIIKIFNVFSTPTMITSLIVTTSLLVACSLWRRKKRAEPALDILKTTFKKLNNKWTAWVLANIIPQVFLLFIASITPLFLGLVLMIFSFILVPSALGYEVGKSRANEIDRRPCKSFMEISATKKNNQDPLYQCTHLTVKGKALMGEIILENNNGYYMRVNTGFLFATKNGNLCIYSKDTDKTIQEVDINAFRFDSPQIDNFCADNQPINT